MDTYRALQDQPRTSAEVNELLSKKKMDAGLRQYVHKLRVSGSTTNLAGGEFTIIDHLHGDIRRGIHRFIEENETDSPLRSKPATTSSARVSTNTTTRC